MDGADPYPLGMYTLRSPATSDAPGLGRAWDDARAHYSELDPESYLSPDPQTPVGQYVLARLMDLAEQPNSFVLVAVDSEDEAVGLRPSSGRPRTIPRIGWLATTPSHW